MKRKITVANKNSKASVVDVRRAISLGDIIDALVSLDDKTYKRALKCAILSRRAYKKAIKQEENKMELSAEYRLNGGAEFFCEGEY